MTLHAPAPLAAHHILDDFNSGNPTLDSWLKTRARANQEGGASRTYVVANDDRVVGYYALATSSIAHRDTTGGFRRNMPDPIPVVALARLAIDASFQKRGLGRNLVQDAGKRVIAAADLVGVRGMIVHAIDEEARRFYVKCGFVPSPTGPMTLMVSLSVLKGSL